MTYPLFQVLSQCDAYIESDWYSNETVANLSGKLKEGKEVNVTQFDFTSDQSDVVSLSDADFLYAISDLDNAEFTKRTDYTLESIVPDIKQLIAKRYPAVYALFGYYCDGTLTKLLTVEIKNTDSVKNQFIHVIGEEPTGELIKL